VPISLLAKIKLAKNEFGLIDLMNYCPSDNNTGWFLLPVKQMLFRRYIHDTTHRLNYLQLLLLWVDL